MNHSVELEHVCRQHALNAWLEDCRTRMARRYPRIDFNANVWDPRKLYGDNITSINLATESADFQGKDRSFADVIRCLAADILLEGVKRANGVLAGFRLLRSTSKFTLFELDLAELLRVEEQCLAAARLNPGAAGPLASSLTLLARSLGTMHSKGVLPLLNYRVGHETKRRLLSINKIHLKNRRKDKASILDHQIEALNEAWNALADKDLRLMPAHQNALAAMGLEMCAPSRINEPLCMSIDDFATINGYTREGSDFAEMETYQAHQMLIITMKGSKGAQWSPKPVLSFMMQFFHFCMDLIKENGKRSRMLVEWYQKNPNKVYLPPELDHFRGKDLTVTEVCRIMCQGKESSSAGQTPARKLFKSRQHAVRNEIRHTRKCGGSPAQVLPWHDVEAGLLELVREAMAECRRVTYDNYYQGDLAKMLFLFDHSENRPPFLPGVFSANFCGGLLKTWKNGNRIPKRTVFEVLGITMPVNGKVQTAFLESHDPRRWLTTMAKIYGSKLSDVLINKWANRLSLAQLWHYDFETLHSKATKSAMPDAPELDGLSKGGIATRPREEVCGLQQRFVEVHDIGVSVVSMDEIYNASKNRPRAKTAEELIVLYANWYGCCAHQHHTAPCRAYSSCLPCGENTVVKGHLPSNDHIRERRNQLLGSIVAEMKRLVDARKYEIADDQDKADAQILALVQQGLDPNQMAGYLIERFHEIKDQIEDIVFRNQLEEAYVATGYVELLDDPNKPSGANLKYTNPSRHAAPGLERGMQAHGGPEAILQRIEDFAAMYPQFAPQFPEQMNQHLLPSPDDENVDDEDKETDDE